MHFYGVYTRERAPGGISYATKQQKRAQERILAKGRNMKKEIYVVCICSILATLIGFGFGRASGNSYWEKRYGWINKDLRTDITNCRTTLNQCKKDLEDPHRCITVCMEEFQKYGC